MAYASVRERRLGLAASARELETPQIVLRSASDVTGGEGRTSLRARTFGE